MSTHYFTNNAVSTLALAASAEALTLTLAGGGGALFPRLDKGGVFNLTLAGLDANGNENRWEIVRVTARSGDVLSVQRGQDNTLARAWPAGSRAELRLTAAVLNRLETFAEQHQRSGALTYEYDESGIPVKSIERIGSTDRVSVYAYNTDGLPHTITTTWPGYTRTETYFYNADGLPTGVQATEVEHA